MKRTTHILPKRSLYRLDCTGLSLHPNIALKPNDIEKSSSPPQKRQKVFGDGPPSPSQLYADIQRSSSNLVAPNLYSSSEEGEINSRDVAPSSPACLEAALSGMNSTISLCIASTDSDIELVTNVEESSLELPLSKDHNTSVSGDPTDPLSNCRNTLFVCHFFLSNSKFSD